MLEPGTFLVIDVSQRSPRQQSLIRLFIPGWMDDSGIRREEDERLSNKAQGTFTTGRRPAKKQPEFSQRSQESVLPGKLNLADYHHVSSALSRLNIKQRQAPLADDEELGSEGGGYAVPQDVIKNGLPGSEYAQPILQEQHRPKPEPRPLQLQPRPDNEGSNAIG